jgi:hypothetical protein
MASKKLMDSVADTTAIAPEARSGMVSVTCEAGSCTVASLGSTPVAVAAGEKKTFDVSPGDPVDIVATSAGTTVWVGGLGDYN